VVHFDTNSDHQPILLDPNTIKQAKRSNQEDALLYNLQGGGRSHTSKSVESLPPVQVVIQNSLSLKDFKRNYPEIKDAKYLYEKYLVPNEILGAEDSPGKMLVKLSQDYNYNNYGSSSQDAFAFAQESNNIAPGYSSQERLH
jgi:hypothetical protein